MSIEIPSTKFHGNQASWGLAGTCGQKGEWTYWSKQALFATTWARPESKKKNIHHFSFSGLIPDISYFAYPKNKERRSKKREKYRSCENTFWIQRSGIPRKDLPKARVKLASLGNQVFPQWRSILKQKNNNQAPSPQWRHKETSRRRTLTNSV